MRALELYISPQNLLTTFCHWNQPMSGKPRIYGNSPFPLFIESYIGKQQFHLMLKTYFRSAYSLVVEGVKTGQGRPLCCDPISCARRGHILSITKKPKENGIAEVRTVHMAHEHLRVPSDRSKGNFRAVCTICGAYQRSKCCCSECHFP